MFSNVPYGFSVNVNFEKIPGSAEWLEKGQELLDALTTSLNKLTGAAFVTAMEVGLRGILDQGFITEGQANKQAASWMQGIATGNIKSTFNSANQALYQLPQMDMNDFIKPMDKAFNDWYQKQDSRTRELIQADPSQAYRAFANNGTMDMFGNPLEGMSANEKARADWVKQVTGTVSNPFYDEASATARLTEYETAFGEADTALQKLYTEMGIFGAGGPGEDTTFNMDADKLAQITSLETKKKNAQAELDKYKLGLENANPDKSLGTDPWVSFLNTYNWTGNETQPTQRTPGQSNKSWWTPTTRWNVY